MTTFQTIAENSSLEFDSLTCPAEGGLDKKGWKIHNDRDPQKTCCYYSNEDNREKAEKIIIKAERVCLISNSITSEVHLETRVKFSERRPV